MSRRKDKAKAEAEEAAAAEAAAAETTDEKSEKKKRGFFGKMVRSSIFAGAVAAAVKYFGDPNQGSQRREKMKGQVKDVMDKQKSMMEQKAQAQTPQSK